MTRDEFIQETIKMKGSIIHNVSLNEYHLNYIIAKYINQDKLFFGLSLMNKLNFATRIEIFKEILNQTDNDYNSRFPNLLKHLNELQSIRNVFAHSMSQVPKYDVYNENCDFDLIKTDKFFASDFSRTKYNKEIHINYLKKLKEILDDLLMISKLEEDSGIKLNR